MSDRGFSNTSLGFFLSRWDGDSSGMTAGRDQGLCVVVQISNCISNQEEGGRDGRAGGMGMAPVDFVGSFGIHNRRGAMNTIWERMG